MENKQVTPDAETAPSLDLDALKIGELPKFDPTPFIGMVVKVTNVDIVAGSFGTPQIRLQTEVVATLGTEEKPVPIRAVKYLSLHRDSEGNVIVAQGKPAHQFMEKYKISSFKEMVGKDVKVQTRTGKDGNEYLTFN